MLLAAEERKSKTKNQHGIRGKELSEIRPDVTWLRKTTYMDNNLFDSVHKFGSQSQFQDQQHKNLQAQRMQSQKTDAQRIKEIKNSFACANGKKASKHPTDPSLKAVRVLPVLPDVERWPCSHMHVGFSEDPAKKDPAQSNEEKLTKRRRVDQALIRDVKKVAPNKFVAPYLLPESGTSENADKYTFRREYEMEVKQMADRSFDYMFIESQTDESVTYAKIEYRIELRKSKVSLSEEEKRERRATTVHLKERDFTEDEKCNREAQFTQLDPDVIDENEDDTAESDYDANDTTE